MTAQKQFSLKKIEPSLAEHLKKLRAIAPESANFLAQKLFTDQMVPGVGNKLAYEDFLTRKKGGVHVMVDGNDLGPLNKELGQSAGDHAIKSMFGAVSRASRANKGKAFRVGGDEGRLHFDTPEQAHLFLRHLNKELEAVPAINGKWHSSVSVGLASSPDEAEQALIQAKNAKKAAKYAPGSAKTHVYSSLPGSAGHIPIQSVDPIPHLREPKPIQSPIMGPAFTAPLPRLNISKPVVASVEGQ